MGPVAYKLQLPPEACIHPVFHASLLKRVVGNKTVEVTLPKGLEADPNDITRPLKCLATRTINRDNNQVLQWLIQWEHGSTDDSTWEDAFSIRS